MKKKILSLSINLKIMIIIIITTITIIIIITIIQQIVKETRCPCFSFLPFFLFFSLIFCPFFSVIVVVFLTMGFVSKTNHILHRKLHFSQNFLNNNFCVCYLLFSVCDLVWVICSRIWNRIREMIITACINNNTISICMA